MPVIRITGRFTEREVRDVTLTDEEYQKLLDDDPDVDPVEMLYDADGEAVEFETVGLDDVEWKLLGDDEKGGA